jgi:hypothetical protein
VQIQFIIYGIIIFIIGVIVHELAHFFTAKHYGGNPKFKWVPKGYIKIFGGNPGIQYQDTMSLKHRKIVALAPVPFNFVFDTLAIACVSLSWFDYSNAETYKIWIFISLCMLFGLLTTLAGSLTDIKNVRELKKNES